MKAAYHTQYGLHDVLCVKEIDKPVPKENELLIRVHATTVNRTDSCIVMARPFIIRFITGLTKPSRKTTGTDFAGVVEAVGSKVTNFKPNDKVWGFNDQGASSHAEYMTIADNKAIMIMPQGFCFAQAAASVEGAHYANNFINKIKLTPGQRVLVNGATGAIGSAMVQLLKPHNVHITAVCKAQHADIVRSLGADEIIDYTSENFTTCNEQFDFVLDAVGKSSFGACKRLLKEHGVFISSELGPGNENIYLPLTTRWSRRRVVFPFPLSIPKSMALVTSLIDQGKFKPLIDREYPLSQVREAFQYVMSGEKIGNVILKMKD